VRTGEFVRLFPTLYHMTAAGSWPTIERYGLRSVTALLDLLYVDPDQRPAIELKQRLHTVRLCDPRLGEFEIRDQKPLNVAKLERCLTDMTVTEWLLLLNRKVFFWPTAQRVEELLGAKLYRHQEHLVLMIDTRSLVNIHEAEITLAPINTGAVLYDPPARGSDTLQPIADYPYDSWRQKRGAAKAIGEVAVDYAVPDIANHVLRVERRRFGHEP
jgi:hypothetical protein